MQGPSKLKLALALLLTLGFGAGCAEERDPINRVQADALDKTFFVADLNDDLDNPVFYSKAFVIDQSAGQSAISVGLYSGTDRVKWEITEDYLLARKGYQIVQGQADGPKRVFLDWFSLWPAEVRHEDGFRAVFPEIINCR